MPVMPLGVCNSVSLCFGLLASGISVSPREGEKRVIFLQHHQHTGKHLHVGETVKVKLGLRLVCGQTLLLQTLLQQLWQADEGHKCPNPLNRHLPETTCRSPNFRAFSLAGCHLVRKTLAKHYRMSTIAFKVHVKFTIS